MQKKLLNNLVQTSYNKDQLDEKKILEIASHLNRKSLKEYIKVLKREERKKTVIVDLPSNGQNYAQEIQPLFPKKKIKYTIDSSLLLGLKITDNDMVYEMNMRDSLDRIINSIQEL